MQVSVPLLTDTECFETWDIINPKSQVCAGEQDKTVCQVIV